ncbi:protease [Shewanella sp. NFH-SH190041]|uniref:signal peptide peptidase SppA n=1 Tax=Shewanella sp. NFH-SH190041 TaxID=2950245 RepID=UPI0021C395A4|nr:signal peptide peptidase SppA [Shewanella sp. NFH-SH190041]BDM64174.1 protease [Shewanella sp. NFH-SH190041]
MSKTLSFFKRILQVLWHTINGTRKLFLNLLFLALLVGIVVALSDEEPVQIADHSALVLNLNGNIVDQKRYVDPLSAALSQSGPEKQGQEILLSDVIRVIDNAADDSRIKLIVLDVGNMGQAGISKLQAVGDALNRFKLAGKQVIADGNFFTQQQYYLASFANQIYLNPEGAVVIDGLARYRLYFKSALDKLDVSTHIFRVGTFKSAVEPYMRDSMSEAAKQANRELMQGLWQSYSEQVAANRNIAPTNLALSASHYLTALDKANGSPAELAMQMKWVDGLLTEDAFNTLMQDKVGKAKGKPVFNQVNFEQYLSQLPSTDLPLAKENIAIVVAKGKILNGKQPAGEIGGESTSALLRKARFDDDIKAVVLRVDSPGGSAFASEQIRQEVLALKAAGKPVVVSMGSLAASGGYWISASADYIYATPTTITGSIGIFGMFTTFEKTLAKLGIHTDGVATTDWAGLSVTRPLSPEVGQVIQRYIDRGYQQFISLVANARHMTTAKVDSIAQGRIWTGKKALELGLVDALGDMPQAVAKAAALAKLKQYDTRVIEQQLSPEQEIIQQMFSTMVSYLPPSAVTATQLDQLLGKVRSEAQTLASFNDPNGVYLYCDSCQF